MKKSMININIGGKSYEVTSPCRPIDLIKQLNLNVVLPVAAVINGHLTRIDKKIHVNSNLSFVEASTEQGKRIYRNTVKFLFLAAFKKLFPKDDVFVQHEMFGGTFAEVKDCTITLKEVHKVKELMKDMVKRELPTNRIYEDWDVAFDVMKEMDRNDLSMLFRYNTRSLFKFYELDGFRDNFYMPLLPNTKYISHFGLKLYEGGILICYDNTEVEEITEESKLFETFQEYLQWSRILKVRTVGHLNRYIMNNEISDLMKISEALHEKKIGNLADNITHGDKVPRVVLIAGPSSSGKTTFSKRLSIQLRVNGYQPVAIGLDDYFKNRTETPLDENGDYDFESLDALDVLTFNKDLKALLNGEEVQLPKFDFISGTRKAGKKLKLHAKQIIIIEGIHGINPKLTESIDKADKYKVYIAPMTQLNLHRHDPIPATDTRLIRRMVRDSYFRGYSAEDTLSRWASVRKGEEKNIFPLINEADFLFNSAIFHEMSVLRNHAEKALLAVTSDSPTYVEAQRLLKFLSFFLPIDANEIPKNSLLREFIGGSSFSY